MQLQDHMTRLLPTMDFKTQRGHGLLDGIKERMLLHKAPETVKHIITVTYQKRNKAFRHYSRILLAICG